MPQFLPFQRYSLWLIWGAVIALIVLSLSRALYLTAGETGALDLHPYWYYGHFVRWGINPYTAYAGDMLLPESAHYLDGSVVAPEAVRQPKLEIIPGHTPSTLFLASLLAPIPWIPLKYIWFVFNLLLIIAMPWLCMKCLPPSLSLTPGLQWLAALSFYAMKGPRFALSNGQPSILIFFLMLLTLLLRQRYWLWAGVALGVALGKYSLALPVAIYLLFEKRFRLLAVAVLVQVLSFIAVTALQGDSLWETIQIFVGMVVHFSGRELGVHLGYLLYDYPQLMAVLVTVGTLVTLALMIFATQRGLLAADVLPLNSLLAVWTLLAVYHRFYDTLLVLYFMIVVLSAISTWRLPAVQVKSLGVVWVLALFFMSLPGDILKVFFEDAQAELYISWIDSSIVVALMAIWVVNLWLVYKTPRVNE